MERPAVYLTGDARRVGDREIGRGLSVPRPGRRRPDRGARVGGLAVIARDAGELFIGLTGVALPFAAASAAAGLLSLGLLVVRRYTTVRLTAAAAVTMLLVAWAAAQYPYVLEPGITVEEAAASDPVLVATLMSLGVGAVLLVPSLVWLYVLFQREEGRGRPAATGEPSAQP